MNGALELTTHILVATLLTINLVGTGLGVIARRRFRQQLAADPGRRRRFYRDFIVTSWIMAAFVPMIAFTSADLSAADLGWAWPGGDGLDYLLASYLLVVIGVGGLRLRRRMRRGRTSPVRAGTAPIVPQTAHERRLAVAVSLTAGITEEVFYRGLLLAVGTRLYHLPLALVAAASLALFVAAHAYQGRRGMVGIAVLGSLFTTVYLVSGSLLLAIVVHVCQDLVALLLVPAYPTVPETTNGPDTESAAEATGHDEVEPVTTSDAASPQPVPPPALRAAAPG